MNAENQKRFEDLFCRILHVPDFRGDYSMGTLVRWDSLKHVELLTEIDEEFNLSIDATELWKMTSVQGILEVLSKYVD